VSNVSEIYTHYDTGDIIIFHTYMPGGPNLRPGYPDELIVHRAVNKTLRYDNYVGKEVLYFTTKGDGNPDVDRWPGTNYDGVPDYYTVGKVVGVVPYVGSIPLFIRTPNGIVTVVILIILVFAIELVYSSVKEKQKPHAEEGQS
jgi:hypothetical protein